MFSIDSKVRKFLLLCFADEIPWNFDFRSIVVIDAKDREFPVSRREKFSKFLP